jgi:hypothetical protein
MSRLPLVVILIAGTASADSKTAKPTSRMTIGTPVVTGSLDAKAVARVIKKSHRKLLDCHAMSARLDGDVEVTFAIDEKGRVTSASARGFTTDVETCVAHVFETIKFRRPKDGQSVDVICPLTYHRLTDGEDENIYGGLLGNQPGEMNGGFGFGRPGFGPDQGGTGWGTIGTGRYGTIGHGSGTGSGYGVGGGRGGMRGRSAAVPTLTLGKPKVQGNLDQAIIRRYLKRNIQKLSYCYEKLLLANDTLEGTVTVQWTIEESGLVATATAKGVAPNVETCVADVVNGIEFPKPKSGSVHVTWPLVYKPAQ